MIVLVVLPMVGAQIAGSALNSIFGASQARKERRANRQAEEDARRHNIEMWNMQNEYNHPSAQMARLQEAGLNPNMIYGASTGQATGQASDISKGNPSEQPYHKNLDLDPAQAMVMHQNIEQSKAQSDNLRTQNTVLTQEALLKQSQRAQNLVNTARTEFDLMVAKELKDTSIDVARENLRVLKQETLGRELDNYFKDKTMSNRVQNVALDIQNSMETLRGQRLRNQLMEYDEELRSMGIERSDAIYWRVLGKFWNSVFGDMSKEDHFKGLEGAFEYRTKGIRNLFK